MKMAEQRTHINKTIVTEWNFWKKKPNLNQVIKQRELVSIYGTLGLSSQKVKLKVTF